MKPNLRLVETTTTLPPRVVNARVHAKLLKRLAADQHQRAVDEADALLGPAPSLRNVALGVAIGAAVLTAVALVAAIVETFPVIR